MPKAIVLTMSFVWSSWILLKGMYLSETLGTFWLDRRKFLLRKKQLGEKENSPMFIVLRKFSSSVMFEAFVKGRIEDMKMTARERSSIMPHHIPLFDICCKYLSVNRLEFTITNIRRIVAKTVVSCTRHIAVGKSIAVRARALDLTADTPFNGDIAEALSDLVESCRECNTNLSVVFSVIWHRIGQTKGSMWRHQLLALHLLKNLLLHGVSFCEFVSFQSCSVLFALIALCVHNHVPNHY